MDPLTTKRRSFLRAPGGTTTLGAAGIALSDRAKAANQAQGRFDGDPFTPVVYHRDFPERANPGVLESAAAAIVRETGHTRYEVGLPWNALTASPTDEIVSLALAIHDVDEGGQTDWLE